MRGAKAPRSCPRPKLNNRLGQALRSVHFCLLDRVFENGFTTLWISDADKGVHEKHSVFLARADASLIPTLFALTGEPALELIARRFLHLILVLHAELSPSDAAWLSTLRNSPLLSFDNNWDRRRLFNNDHIAKKERRVAGAACREEGRSTTSCHVELPIVIAIAEAPSALRLPINALCALPPPQFGANRLIFAATPQKPCRG